MPVPSAFLLVPRPGEPGLWNAWQPDWTADSGAASGPWRGLRGEMAGFDHASGASAAAAACACPVCADTSPTTPQAFMDPMSGVAPNGLPIFSWTEAALQLTRDSNGWSGVVGAGAVVTYSFRASAPNMPSDTAGFVRFTEAQIIATELALQLWADVANITFVRVGTGATGEAAYSNAATIVFGNYSSGADGAAAFAYFPGSTSSGSVAGDIWINISLESNSELGVGEYGLHTIAHEIGHAIGISHPADYGALDDTDPTYPESSVYWQDSRAYSIMSYFGSGGVGHSLGGFAAGPQLHDIAAAQRLYGVNTTTRTGDTVYGFNSNTGLAHFTITADGQTPVFAIWDAGGNDTINFSGYSTAVEIDLREEAFSSAGPGTNPAINDGMAYGNIAIARGAVIENAIGGAGNDTITGNAVANVLYGGSGNDTLNGGAGNDTLYGQAGNDAMAGGADNDIYYVNDAGDTVTESAGQGTDLVNAWISYALTANVENLTLLGAVTDGVGNALANIITGNDANNVLFGLDGNDTLVGGVGNDTLYGGLDTDTLVGGVGNDSYYVNVTGDVITELSGEGVDTAYGWVSYTLGANVENLILLGNITDGIGNGLGNVITGNDANNNLFGLDGADTLNGGVGNDALYGGTGGDTLVGGVGNDSYYVDSAGDVVTELSGEGTDSVFAYVSHTLAANVENLTLLGGAVNAIGNSLANTLTGNALNNSFTGNAGNDTFVFGPGAGDDTIADFVAGGTDDTINLQAYNGSGVTWTIAQVGADTVFSFSNGDSITLTNVTAANLVQIDPWTYG